MRKKIGRASGVKSSRCLPPEMLASNTVWSLKAVEILKSNTQPGAICGSKILSGRGQRKLAGVIQAKEKATST